MKKRTYKTSEARRRTTKRYEEYIERINPTFPMGTKERIRALGEEHPGSFVKQAVLEKLMHWRKSRAKNKSEEWEGNG